MKLKYFKKYFCERGIMSAVESTNWKGSYSEPDVSDDGEPRLQIVDNIGSENASRQPFHRADACNASEAVESLLMLGRAEVWPKSEPSMTILPLDNKRAVNIDLPKIRKISSRENSLSGDEKGAVTYYQKMRERNNEASKRCRLKRRLKAESLEVQLSSLATANKMLKTRLARMENICKLMKEGIKLIQNDSCHCMRTVSMIQEVNRTSGDTLDMSNIELLNNSRNCRDRNPDVPIPSSSDEDLFGEVTSTDSPLPVANVLPVSQPPSFSGVLMKVDPKPVVQAAPTSSPFWQQEKPKTVLDVLNDTIVKSLGPSPPPAHSTTVTSKPITPVTCAPMNFLRLVPAPLNCKKSESSPVIVVTPNSSDTHTQLRGIDSVKKEITETSNGVDPTETCVASAMDGPCKGPLLNLNKLTSYVDVVTGLSVLADECSAAMEKAVIKSRMKIPFWKADEFTSFICDGHRQTLLQRPHDPGCLICGKKRTKKVKSPHSVMYLITYRMSLENHIKTGSILPIGYLVCGFCKEKYLKGIDFSSCPISNDDSVTIIKQEVPAASISNLTTFRGPTLSSVLPMKRPMEVSNDQPGHNPPKIRPSPPCFSAARCSNSSEVQVIIQPVQKEVPQVQITPIVPASQAPWADKTVDNIFSKISKLNEALHAINPKCKPINFSITSAIDSCSESILNDAISAAETAVSTVMSVIAPGQESFLWNSIKPVIDKNLKT